MDAGPATTTTSIDNAFAFPGWRRRALPGAPPVALVLLNRPLEPAFLRAVWGAADFRIAADGAARRLLDAVPAARRCEFLPDAVCGDFDSIDDDARCVGLRLRGMRCCWGATA